MMMTSQKGILYIRQTGLILVVAFLVLLGYRLVPVYFEYITVKNVVLAMDQLPGMDEKSERKWTAELQKQFDINNISRIRAKDLEIDKQESHVTVGLQYEVRENLLFNIDLMVSFNEKFNLPLLPSDEHESS
ncbi:MAG: DUF4845 domain-containing protein [Gammaproteobacteria bacterium]|nr:DUF4845 domain-containing protein [Gammaproteobacteria bacterium]